ncbi:MAG: hypothetical protein KKB02_03370 [Alphaproteobacteria bacterium]|nr:hypothetical protein [Alphaproteobacteria bacterium]
MKETFIHPLRPTAGERRLCAAAVVVGLCGGVLSFFIVAQMGGTKTVFRSLTQADLWFVASGILGALGGLYLGRQWLGFAGATGMIRALRGIIAVSFVGTLIGGTLALPFYGTMFGPLMFVLTLVDHPGLAALWLATLIACHLLFKVWRKERAQRAEPAVAARRPTYFGPRTQSNWLTPRLDKKRR